MTEKATFGAGCFWGVETEFRKLPGVVTTAVGYMGGKTDCPTYQDVCAGTTNHAEVVEITFDPSKITYEKILDCFWASHDPTQKNRQGPDVGTQYRSVIFFHNEKQKLIAGCSKAELKLARPVATEIIPVTQFWLAEDYHQQYLEKRGLGSCHL